MKRLPRRDVSGIAGMALTGLLLGAPAAFAQVNEGFDIIVPAQTNQPRMDLVEVRLRATARGAALADMCVFAELVGAGGMNVTPFAEEGGPAQGGWPANGGESSDYSMAADSFYAAFRPDGEAPADGGGDYVVRFLVEPVNQNCISRLDSETRFRVRIGRCDGAPQGQNPVGLLTACVEAFRVQSDPGQDDCPPMPLDQGHMPPVEPAVDGAFYPSVRPLGLPDMGQGVRPVSRCMDQLSRPAIHAAFVVDTSGSMAGLVDNRNQRPLTKAQMVTQAIDIFIRVWAEFRAVAGDENRPDDRIGVVFFNSDARATQYDDFCTAGGGRPLAIGNPPDATADACQEPWCVLDTQLRDERRVTSGPYMRQFVPACRDFKGSPCTNAELPINNNPLVESQPWCSPLVGNGAVPAGGATSIGDGLLQAVGPNFLDMAAYRLPVTAQEATDGRRNVVVLFSDGQHNSPCNYEFDRDGKLTFSQCPGEPPPVSFRDPQTGQQRAVLHTVAVGQSSADEHRDALQRDAHATGGSSYFINEHNAAAIFDLDMSQPVVMGNADALRLTLQEYFLDILHNTLRFNTWYPARRIRLWVPPSVLGDGEPRVTLLGGDNAPLNGEGEDDTQERLSSFYVPSTARAVSVVALWDENYGDLEVTLTQPGRPFPLTRRGRGFIQISRRIERGGTLANDLPWTVRVRRRADGASHIPVTVIAFVDHFRVKPDFAVRGTFEVESPLAITASLRAFDTDALGVGDGAGRIYARVRRTLTAEAQAVLNNCLARVMEGALVPDGAADQGSRRSEILGACFAEHPDELTNLDWSDPLELVDDGTGADERPGDGVYSAAFTPTHAGDHEFSIVVDGQLPGAGWTSFHHMETIHIKQMPMPASADEMLRLSRRMTALQEDGVDTMRVEIEPRDAAGELLGPGLDGRLWLRVYQRDEARQYDFTDIMMHGLDEMTGVYHADLPLGDDGLPPYAEVVFMDVAIGYSPMVPMADVEDKMRDRLHQMDLRGQNSQKQGRLVVLMRIGDSPELLADPSCDCNAADGASPVGLLAGLLLLLRVRRRRR